MSMATDDERREVARRLREEADYPGHAVQYMEQFISDLRQVLFGDLNPTADYSEMFARLADLIEPTDGFDLDTVQRVRFECMGGCDEPERARRRRAPSTR